jgi:hypothetical protein
MDDRRAIRRSAAWPWIIGVGAIVLVVLVVAVIRHRQPAQQAATPVAAPAAEATSGAASMPAPVGQYLDFAAATKDRLHGSATHPAGERAEHGGATAALPPLTLAHDYTAEGLRHLADALAAVEGASASSVAQSLRADADELQKNPKSLRHADIVRDAFDKVAKVVSGRIPDEGRRLRDLASAINANRPLLDQRDAVQEFFVAAGDSVRQMTSPS